MAPVDGNRRRLTQAFGITTPLAASLAGGCAGLAPRGVAPQARVLVVGGGWAGATAAAELRRLGGDRLEVVLVERSTHYVSGPRSNTVLGGSQRIDELTRDYAGLRARGVQVLNDDVVAVDPHTRRVTLRKIADQGCDVLVLATGVALRHDAIEGLGGAAARAVLPAWQHAGETVALRRRLEAMADGGVFLLSVPRLPYRGDSAPYERACQVARYLHRAKPRARVLVLDANPAGLPMPEAFERLWRHGFPGRIERHTDADVVAVDVGSRSVLTARGERFRGDVLNLVPAQAAPALLQRAGLVDVRSGWVPVDWRSMGTASASSVHVIGDATRGPPALPKSASMAVLQARTAAAAIVARLEGREPAAPRPVRDETDALVDDHEALRVVTDIGWTDGRPAVRPIVVRPPNVVTVPARDATSRSRRAWDELLG